MKSLRLSTGIIRVLFLLLAIFTVAAPLAHYRFLQPEIDRGLHPFGFTSTHLLLLKHFADFATYLGGAFLIGSVLWSSFDEFFRRILLVTALFYLPFAACYIGYALFIVSILAGRTP